MIMHMKTGRYDGKIVAMVVPTIMDSFPIDKFVFIIQLCLVNILYLAYIPLLYRTVHRVVSEKETRVKETMKMMGLNDFPYWCSWFVYYSTTNTCIAVLCTGLLSFGMFPLTNPLIIFMILLLYGQCQFGLFGNLSKFLWQIEVSRHLHRTPVPCSRTDWKYWNDGQHTSWNSTHFGHLSWWRNGPKFEINLDLRALRQRVRLQ